MEEGGGWQHTIDTEIDLILLSTVLGSVAELAVFCISLLAFLSGSCCSSPGVGPGSSNEDYEQPNPHHRIREDLHKILHGRVCDSYTYMGRGQERRSQLGQG